MVRIFSGRFRSHSSRNSNKYAQFFATLPAKNIYSDKQLLAEDSSSPDDIKFRVTSGPKQGAVFNTKKLEKVREFTQGEINRNEISYKIDLRKANDVVRAHDTFQFTVEDGWGNASKERFEFIATWSSISFETSRIEVCEESKGRILADKSGVPHKFT